MLKAEIKDKIISNLLPFNPEKVILFGSYTYGKHKRKSDIDLLIVKNLPENEVRSFRLMIKKELFKQFKDYSLFFDIIVDSEPRIQERIKIGDSFYNEIYSKGQLIYS